MNENITVTESICELLLNQAKVIPQIPAILSNNKTLTYQELVQQCLNIADILKSFDLHANDCVGIYLYPSIELVLSVWGILFSGAAYLPCSPEYPLERSRYILENTDLKIIITSAELKPQLASITPNGCKIITIDQINNTSKAIYTNKIKLNINKNDLAYVIYTSGSTGKPKGVMIEHHSIANQMFYLHKQFKLGKNTIILQKTPIAFDAAQWEILALCYGATVVMGEPGMYKSPNKIIQTIDKHKVSTLQCVPTLLQGLINIDNFRNCHSLKQIFSGGEALYKDIAKRCTEVLPNCELINLYGPTECTINTSSFKINKSLLSNYPNIIPIGKPIYNTKYYILDDQLNPVVEGNIGELYIAGEGVSRGYVNSTELSMEKFITNHMDQQNSKLYKTGDLVAKNTDGSYQYAGRTDRQIKLRGYRIELDEIQSSINHHNWINHAGVIVKKNPYTGYENLIAFIELNKQEAALMDQSNHAAHHVSKVNKSQIKFQLRNLGCRKQDNTNANNIINLAGKIPNEKQIKTIFARKSYRFYEGSPVTKKNIFDLLSSKDDCSNSIELCQLSLNTIGSILRYFGQFRSATRILPKYGYASPGALYATQMYLDISGIAKLSDGYYYYHPIKHQLILIKSKKISGQVRINLHFIGKKNAIEPIYKNNIREVLEIEAGHMVGLFENILPDYGLKIRECEYKPSAKQQLSVANEDYYLGTFEIISGKNARMEYPICTYVQTHGNKVEELPQGLYLFMNNKFIKQSDAIIRKKDVIAINQAVYDRAAFAISITSRAEKKWMSFINLGRKLQNIQMNDLNLGFMSSGYSSHSGNNLPSANRIEKILARKTDAFYFFLGGSVSKQQVLSQGMKEDLVHMRGPTEMLKNDLLDYLPEYMMPNNVIVLDHMPLTSNGKIDYKTLQNINLGLNKREYIAPRNHTEKILSDIWQQELNQKNISVKDNFFELGGNSLITVSLISQINVILDVDLPLQIIFNSPTIEQLAKNIIYDKTKDNSRLIPLQAIGTKKPIFCWPGLGGYCMNLRLLAKKMIQHKPFYGIQAYGINEGEQPYTTLQQIAKHDIALIKTKQREGPYTLWGYSFGARVAYEIAFQLEQSGDIVNELCLIAPGSPKVNVLNTNTQNQSIFSNYTFLTILYSVFTGSISDKILTKMLLQVADEESFINFISRHTKLERTLINRIVKVVSSTYKCRYPINEIKQNIVTAPINVYKTKGDHISFIESKHSSCKQNINIFSLNTDHYSVLKQAGIQALFESINAQYKNSYGFNCATNNLQSAPHKDIA